MDSHLGTLFNALVNVKRSVFIARAKHLYKTYHFRNDEQSMNPRG